MVPIILIFWGYIIKIPRLLPPLQILIFGRKQINNGGFLGAIAAPIFFPQFAAKRPKKT